MVAFNTQPGLTLDEEQRLTDGRLLADQAVELIRYFEDLEPELQAKHLEEFLARLQSAQRTLLKVLGSMPSELLEEAIEEMLGERPD